MRLRGTGFWVGLLAVLLAVAARADAQPTAARSPLVSVEWLMQHLDDPSVRIVDLGKPRDDYEAAHIPRAQYVDWRVELIDPDAADYFGVAQPEAVEALLSRLGVAADSIVVLYDSQSSRIAARMYWTLRRYGHADVRILDGGARAWAAAGGRQSSGVEPVAPTRYRIASARDDVIANLDFVERALAGSDTAIVDARAPEFYTGASFGSKYRSDTPNARAGHVPGAKNFFWADHFNEDGTFKSVTELRAQYAAAGITPDKPVITYCHIGLQGSTPWFVLSELLGFTDVRLYDYSMAEWANALDTPLIVGDE